MGVARYFLAPAARERWALLGENGAGKTQLLKLLSGDVWPTPNPARCERGAAYRLGRRRAVDLIDAKARIAYVGAEQQDKYARYGWNLRVRDLVATGLHRTDLLHEPVTPSEAKRVAATLRACGLRRHAGAQIPVFVVWPEAPRVVGARAGAGSGLAAARRTLQRARPRVSPAHRCGARGRAPPRPILGGGRASCRRRAAGNRHCGSPGRVARRPGIRRRSGGLARAQISPRLRARGRRGRTAQPAERVRASARRQARRGCERQGARLRKAAVLRLSKVDLYVEYRPVLRDVELAAAQGRALGRCTEPTARENPVF